MQKLCNRRALLQGPFYILSAVSSPFAATQSSGTLTTQPARGSEETPLHIHDVPVFWATVGLGVATLLAVLVALFGDLFRDKFWPPVLRLELASPEGELTQAVIKAPPNEYEEREKRTVPARYYHLRVSNARRWSKATDVQIVLLRVERRGLDGEYTMEWNGAVPFQWRHQELYPILRTVGAEADADLVAVLKDKWLELVLLVRPNNLETRHRSAVSLVLHVEARANEGSAPVLRIRVSWDGGWHDGAQEMRRNCVVEVLE